MEIKEIQKLAKEYGVSLTEKIRFNEMGVDFRVGFATDTNGKEWLIRIPRREDMGEQINNERKILQLVEKHLSVKVPDWKIVSPHLIAYPLIEEKPVLMLWHPVRRRRHWSSHENGISQEHTAVTRNWHRIRKWT